MKAKRSVFSVFLAACALWALMPAAFATDEPAGADGIAAPENEAVPAEASDNMEEPAAVFQDGAGSAAALPASAGAEDGGETETESVIYISDLTSLETFRDSVNGGDSYAGKTVVLTADIDMSGSYGEGIASWMPIGNDTTTKFTGTFDGGGHTVSGLYINAADSDYQGLFGILGGGGEIKNLGVGGAVTGKNCIGGVCGDNYEGKIENCYNTGVVSGAYYVGGVCGFNNDGTITNCYNTGAVSGTGDNIGGVCSFNFGNLTNCYNTGAVSGTGDNIGGVCGRLFAGTVENCYYLDTCGAAGLGASVTVAQFNSGEAAWMLQSSAWGQTLGKDTYPVLGGEPVYQVTFQEDGKDEIVRYCNAGALSDLPEITARDGYTAQWQTRDGAAFAAGTAVSGDIVLTAAWIAAAGTPEPEPTGTPEPEATATPEPEPTGTPQPSPTGTPEPAPTGTPQPSPTGTSEPAPTATPQPETTAAPHTGDGSAPGLWLTLLVLAAAGLTEAAARAVRKQKR